MTFVERSVKQLLRERQIDFQETEHDAVFTSEQAAQIRGLESARQGVKAMIFKTDSGKYLLILNPGDKRVDTKKVAQMEDVKHLSLATGQEVERISGAKVGCVAPFGLKTKLKTYLNRELLDNENLYFNPGSHTKTIKIKAKDLTKAIEEPIFFS